MSLSCYNNLNGKSDNIKYFYHFNTLNMNKKIVLSPFGDIDKYFLKVSLL